MDKPRQRTARVKKWVEDFDLVGASDFLPIHIKQLLIGNL
jgi:hypothetical protein